MKTSLAHILTAASTIALTAGLTSCGPNGGNEQGTISEGTLKIGVTSDTKPYAYTENGEIKGFDVEIARAVADQMGLEPEFVAQEFSTLLPAVSNGQLDMAAASVASTEERKETVDFSDSYFIGYITVLARKDSGITEEPSTLDGARLGVVQGTIQDSYSVENFTDTEIVRFPDNNSAVSALGTGSIDAHFLDYPVAQEYAENDPNDAFEITVNIEVSEFPVAFPVRKGNEPLRGGLNEAIAAIIADGTWLEIEEQYFPDQPVPEQFLPTE